MGLSTLRLPIILLRMMFGIVSVVSLFSAAEDRADGVAILAVPSAATGRDIQVAFQGGGPHAVFLLNPFDVAPDVANWVTAGNALKTLAGKDISVVGPASGAGSRYTEWEQDATNRRDKVLSSEPHDWLAANYGLALGDHGVVDAAQGERS